MRLSFRFPLFAFSLSALASACAQETVVQDLNEKEANQIVEALAKANLDPTKLRVAEGRNVSYSVTVPGGSKIEAYRTLNQNELPRRRDNGYKEVFQAQSLIPSSAEERAKAQSALEGEIEGQLKLIDDVLDARVQIVMPEESALRTTQDQKPPTTASATIKFQPDGQGRSPVPERTVAAIISRSVEGLSPDNVFVMLAPATGNSMVTAGAEGAETSRSWLGRLSLRTVNIITVLALVVFALLCVGLVFSQMRLVTVRGRLLRLQNEIAKARRKPNEGAPSNAA